MTRTAKSKNVVLLLSMVLTSLAAGGCGCGQNWTFALKSQNEKAVIDMDGVTLVFEGVVAVLPDL